MDIAYIVLCMLHSLIDTYLAYSFLSLQLGPSKCSTNVKLIFWTLFFIIFTATSIWDPASIVTFFIAVSAVFVLVFLFDGDRKKKLLAVVFAYCFLLLSEGLGVLMGKIMPPIESETVQFAIRLFFEKAISIIVLFLLRTEIKRIADYSASLKTWFLLFTTPLLTVVFVVTYTYEIEKVDESYIILLVILVLINFIVLFLYSFMAKDYSELVALRSAKTQEEYYLSRIQDIQKNEEAITSFKHDIKHMLITLRSYLDSNDVGDAIGYLESISSAMPYGEGKQIESGIIEIDALLNDALQRAASMEIESRLKIDIPKELPFSPIDITIVLGNILDNAIEATSFAVVESRFLDIEIVFEYGCLKFTVKNSYNHSRKPRTMSFADSELMTTKEDGRAHGYGLRNVKAIIEKYNGLMDISFDNDVFSVEVLLIGTNDNASKK